MKIFYTASYYGKEKYQKYYDAVLHSIESTGVELISPEKGNYLNMLSNAEKLKIKDKKRIHYEAIRRGIQWADAVIIEISNEDFQLGHEATLAIQNKKPVLCLSIYEDFSEKIVNRYFHGAKYNEYNVRMIVGEFIRKINKELHSVRFNCFLTANQVKFLNEMSEKNNMNKSEYLRKLIDQERG